LLAIWIIEPFEELVILLPYIAWIKKEMLQTHDISWVLKTVIGVIGFTGIIMHYFGQVIFQVR
jgi:hypothetical protein